MDASLSSSSLLSSLCAGVKPVDMHDRVELLAQLDVAFFCRLSKVLFLPNRLNCYKIVVCLPLFGLANPGEELGCLQRKSGGEAQCTDNPLLGWP